MAVPTDWASPASLHPRSRVSCRGPHPRPRVAVSPYAARHRRGYRNGGVVYPDPARSLVPHQENKGAVPFLLGLQCRNAELRGEVQQRIASTTKGKNITPCAHCIADGLKGRHSAGWSPSGHCVWRANAVRSATNLPQAPTCSPCRAHAARPVVAVDGETQAKCVARALRQPGTVWAVAGAALGRADPFELYWGLGVDDAL